jgi:chitinase
VNLKNNFPASPAYVARRGKAEWHLQNVALLPWYMGAGADAKASLSFPDRSLLTRPATPCPATRNLSDEAASQQVPKPRSDAPFANGHGLIGYWTGRGPDGQPFPLGEVSPQWDIVIVAFASPVKGATEGTLQFKVPKGLDPDQVKRDVSLLKSQGKKVMISLGGGGAFFTLNDPAHIDTFVSSVTQVVEEYGFDGIDIDFETPSLVIQPGDRDPRHPTTPSIVNLISGLRQLHDHFGPGFMISLVPEGPQFPAGYLVYGGQFGSYLPLAYGLGDMLSFIDVQYYNTPPLEGLDGEIYQSQTADYDAALTEIMLQGFRTGGSSGFDYPPMPPGKVMVGFLTDYQMPQETSEAMDFLIEGKAPASSRYRLKQAAGYPSLFGAMFWTIDDDRARGYSFSNLLGPQLHSYPAAPQPLIPPGRP